MGDLGRKEPVLLPNVSLEMLRPEFWIDRPEDPPVDTGCFCRKEQPLEEAFSAYRRELEAKKQQHLFNFDGSSLW